MQAFRDTHYRFAEANAQVLGISVDSFAAAGEYQDKLGLEFPLLSDFPRNQTGRDYGVYDENYGIDRRTTVVIDENHIVRDVYEEARDFTSHPAHALDVLESLGPV
jgi:peroxiredoxin